MAADRGTSFPFGGLAVVALFLTTTFLGQQGFELLRQADGETGKRPQRPEPTVEARLWEDPFTALIRHRDKLKDRCPAAGSALSAGQRADPACQARPPDSTTFKKTLGSDAEDVTLIAVMLPGAALVGAEEARRRTRYAVLAGLNAEDFVPDDSEHMGLVRVRYCEGFSRCGDGRTTYAASQGQRPETWSEIRGALGTMVGTALEKLSKEPAEPPTTDIVYETLTAKANDKAKRRRVAVLWIDDTAIGQRWLSTLTIQLKDLAPPGARLRILGPSASDALVKALDHDLTSLEKEATELKTGQERNFEGNWQTLAKLRLISPQATTSAERLRKEAGLSEPACNEDQAVAASTGQRRDCVDEAFRTRLGKIRDAFGQRSHSVTKAEEPIGPQFPFFVRTVGADNGLIELLVEELCARGFADRNSRRVVLFGEWDSIYARSFADALHGKPAGGCPGDPQKKTISIEFYSYLRGLDGAGLDGAPKQVRLVRSTSDKTRDERKDSAVEWPESRDQRDYVRRLIKEITRQVERDVDVEAKAIGIIGSDVHDKLVLAQALRTAFPDRTLFTTDLDARLLHPDVNEHTRNMIVASSLPLMLGGDLQRRIPPFRDSYQTATFLAARYASVEEAGQGGLLTLIRDELARPHIFEIGLRDHVELSTKHRPQSEDERRGTYGALAGVVLLGLAGLVMFGYSAPAMSAARRALFRNKAPEAHFNTSSKFVSGLEAAGFGFAAGVVFELCAPGSTGFAGAFLLALATAAFFWAFLYPGLRNLWSRRGRSRWSLAWRWLTFIFFLLMFVLMALALAGIWGAEEKVADVHEPFAPFSGVSAWPGQLLRTLMVVLFVWFLDYAWCESADACRRIEAGYFPVRSRQQPVAEPAKGRWRRAWLWLRRQWRMVRIDARRFAHIRGWRFFRAIGAASVWLWQPVTARPDGNIDGTRLWREYRKRLRNWPRLGRVFFWWLVAMVLLAFGNHVMGGAFPEIPARGIADRNLFLGTLLISGMVLITLLVLVGDSTILTWRVISMMKRGRTIYPRATVERFARKLGPELQKLAAQPIAARIPDREEVPDAALQERQTQNSLYGYGPTQDAAARRPAARNSLLDDWIDAHLIAEHTAAIGPLIVCPFILLALAVVARSQLFDNWAIGGNQLVVLIAYVLWSIAMAAMLNIGAEITRQKAVTGMQDDLMWLKGAGPAYAGLAERFPSLIEQVRDLRQGAFAPFFEQPLVRAILVPLGGAGGVQLVEYLMFARAQ